MLKVSTLEHRRRTVLSPVEKLRFVIKDFAEYRLPPPCRRVVLPALVAHGYKWSLSVGPFGDADVYVEGVDEEAYVSIYLRMLSEDVSTVDAEYACRVNSLMTVNIGRETYSSDGVSAWGRGRFISRKKLLKPENHLLDDSGALVIDVDLQVYVKILPAVWYPPNTSASTTTTVLTELLETGCCSDITILVNGHEFTLHRFILAIRAPALFQMIVDPPLVVHQPTILTLDDVVAPDIFRAIVHHIYTGDFTAPAAGNEVIAASTTILQMLILSDRFGCTRLKLWIESVIVDQHLNVDNAADMLLVGDAHRCALLKEAAMKLCVDKAGQVIVTEGWKRVVESNALLAELFRCSAVAPHTSNNEQPASGDPDDDTGRSVAELRDRLLKRGRDDVDGSREMLVKRLKETHG